ncbi:ER membrane protein complex subunit 1 isoform X2 [Rhodnius prolixus]|uniref:ER membrane protein complex subunit 1 isoform X2 n=1 Tax=Rhodnius prolixus TaxID=13249 RepID=UPI003D189B8F
MFLREFIKFCLLVIVFPQYYALYEDQVGKFDWKQTFVGKVIFSYLDLDPKSQRLFVATENNVVAAVNIRGGKLLWRHLLESDELGKIHVLYVSTEIVTVSGNGPYLMRGWNPTNGVQVFEWSLPPFVGGGDGVWAVDHNRVYQVKFFDMSLEVTAFYLRSGNSAGSTKIITSPWLSSKSKCCISGNTVICVLPESHVVTLRLSEMTHTSHRNSSMPGVTTIRPLVGSTLPACLAELEGGGLQLMVLTNEGELIVRSVPSRDAVVFVTNTTKQEYLMITLTYAAEENEYEVKMEELRSGVELKERGCGRLVYSHPLPKPEHLTASCTEDPAGSMMCYLFVTAVDHSAILLRRDKVLWIREESLANILAVEMIDLPVSDAEAAIEKEFADKEGGVFGMLTRRLSSQLLQLKTLISTVIGLASSSKMADGRAELVRDTFGLHKIIVAVTKSSKVFGIDNEKGDINWQFYLKDLTYFNVHKEEVPMYVQRTARHLPHPSIVTLLMRHKITGETVIFSFNPITGQAASETGPEGKFLESPITQALLLPKQTEEFINGLLLMTNNSEVIIWPESARSVALQEAHVLYIYNVNVEAGTITGYNFHKEEQVLVPVEIWKLNLPEKIECVVGKRLGERVHSQGRVLADRSVLYKYINPNLVVAVTHSQDPLHKNTVGVILLDTVSGDILLSLVHKRATLPIHVVHSENWIVYSYFNDKSRRTEIVTLDLYEGKVQKNTTAFSSLDPPVSPLVERQAYIFPHIITSMKETITEKGITSKHVLVGLSTGSVMEVPWAVLDPRRSINPTAEMRDEGVLPYMPELVLPLESIITYNHTLASIKDIHTSAATLESTSLVFVHGLDIFYTRVAPSKTFDVLKDDFEYWLITAVLSGLILAAFITKRLASRKALKLAWK